MEPTRRRRSAEALISRKQRAGRRVSLVRKCETAVLKCADAASSFERAYSSSEVAFVQAKRDKREGHHRWRRRGRRIVRGAPAQAGRKGRDRHGGARPVHVVCELRPAVSHLRRDRAGIEPDGGERGVLPHALCNRRANQLRGGFRLGQRQDRRPARRRDRQGDEGALRQAGAVSRRALGPPATYPASTCPESSRSGPCPMCGRSASGSKEARPSSPACTTTRESSSSDRRAGPS